MDEAAEFSEGLQGMDLIAKPFTLDALAAKIRRMIESQPPPKAT